MPHELALVGIYFSPLLPIVLFGILGALATAFVLNRTGLSGWFANPPWVFMRASSAEALSLIFP